MTFRSLPLVLAAALALAACHKEAQPAATAPPLQPVGSTAAQPGYTTAPTGYAAPQPAPAGYGAPGAPAAGQPQAAPNAAAASNAYSCSFPGPNGRAILARFTLDGNGGARDDQNLPFTVIANSPTAVVLAHARDNTGASPDGDVGAYVVAIDRTSLGMVQSTVGLRGPEATRRGRCIAG